ncbi:hypothetical protein V5O48_012621, partial [Marasmius crinis-equi]
QHWDQIWPWVQALSRCVLESDKIPKTPRIEAEVAIILEALPVILTHPTYKPNCVEFRDELYPLLASTPKILELSTTLWLHTSHHKYPDAIATAFCDCTGNLLLSSNFHRLANEGPPKTFLDAVGNTRYDFGVEIVKIITRHSSGPDLSCKHLIAPTVILYTAQVHPNSNCVEICLKNGAVRLVGSMIRRLTSSRKMKQWWAYGFNNVCNCVVQGMHFLIGMVRQNPLGILEALDEGIIPAIVRAKEFLLEDAKRRPVEWGNKGSPSLLFEEFLEMICRRLLLRRIMIRAARAVGKVQKMKLADDYFEGYGNLKTAWSNLRIEVERSLWIYKSEDGVANTFRERICGYEKCPMEVGTRKTHRFLRCSGCIDTLYCSHLCQKKDWKDKHRNKCQQIRTYVTRAGSAYLSRLDHAYVANQTYYDYHHADRSHIKGFSPTANPSQYVIKMDYTQGDLGPKMEVLTRAQYLQLMGDLLLPGRPMRIRVQDVSPYDKTPPAVACVPWWGDTVKVWDVDKEKIELQDIHKEILNRFFSR